MINRECNLCHNYVNDVWTLEISDNNEKVFISGHKECIDQLDDKVKAVKDLSKKSVAKVIKEIGFSGK